MLSGSILFTVEPCFCCSQCWGLDVKCTRQVQMFEHLVLGWCAVLRNCGTFRRQGLPRGSTGWGVEQALIFIAQLCFLSFLLPNLLRNEPVASHSCCSQECLPLPCLPCQDVATINLTSINLPLATITMTKEHNNSEFIYCCKSLGIILIASIAPSSEAESILRICFLGWYCVTLFLGRDKQMSTDLVGNMIQSPGWWTNFNRSIDKEEVTLPKCHSSMGDSSQKLGTWGMLLNPLAAQRLRGRFFQVVDMFWASLRQLAKSLCLLSNLSDILLP